MILFLGMQLLPVGYAIFYLRHSIRKRRRGQAFAIGVLLLFELFACAVLLWEFFFMP